MSTHIAIRALSVEPRMVRQYRSGVGDTAIFEQMQNGWIINLEDRIQLVLPEKPSFPLIITVSDPT